MRRRSLGHDCLTLLICISLVGLSAMAQAQSGPGCPAMLSSLMPGNAVKVTCQYNAAGVVGMGFATANLPFKNICANQVTPTPGKISYNLKHYAGESIGMFKMQIGPEEQQRTKSKLTEFEKQYAKLKAAKNPQLVSLSPLTTETVNGGSISYFGYETGRDGDALEMLKPDESKPWTGWRTPFDYSLLWFLQRGKEGG